MLRILLVITMNLFSGVGHAAHKCDDWVCTEFECHCNDDRLRASDNLANLESRPKLSDSHVHHTKHNMILVGEEEIFASHIVYKSPHNYQVLLSITFEQGVKSKYFSSRENYPEDDLILLLDEMDISKIQQTTTLSGALLRKNANTKSVIDPHVVLSEGSFKVLYFDELPLNLDSSTSSIDSTTLSKQGLSRTSFETLSSARRVVDGYLATATRRGSEGSTHEYTALECDRPSAEKAALSKCRNSEFESCVIRKVETIYCSTATQFCQC